MDSHFIPLWIRETYLRPIGDWAFVIALASVGLLGIYFIYEAIVDWKNKSGGGKKNRYKK